MKYIWKQILVKVNKELINQGVGVKHIKDIDNALALLVRRTFKIENMKEVETVGESVEKFALAMVNVIAEGRKSIGETL